MSSLTHYSCHFYAGTELRSQADGCEKWDDSRVQMLSKVLLIVP